MRVLICEAGTPLKLSAAILLLLPALACQAAEPAPAATLGAEPQAAEAKAAPVEPPAVMIEAAPVEPPAMVVQAAPVEPPAVVVEAAPAGKVSNIAVGAALADGLTTAAALGSGAIESNPLIPTSPLGLIAITSAKILLVKYADTLPEQDKRTVVKTTSAAWGGAAINNLMVMMAAPPPMPILAGFAMAFMTWKYTSHKYEQQDALAAASKPAPAAPGAPVAPVAPAAPAEPAGPVAADTVTGLAQSAAQ